MKRAIIIGGGKLAVSLFSIVIWKIYAGYLTLTDIGVITLLMNFDSFFGLVAASPLGNYLSATALSDLKSKSIGQKVGAYLTTLLLLSALAFFLFLFYDHFLNLHTGIWWALLFMVYVYLNNAVPIGATVLTVLDKTETSVLLQVIKAFAVVLFVYIALQFSPSVNSWILSGIIASCITWVFTQYVLHRQSDSFGKMEFFNWRKLVSRKVFFSFLLPLAMLQLLSWYFFSSYRVYSGKFFDLEFVGKVGLVFTFASQICSAFDSVVTQLYQPDFYRLMQQDSKEAKLKKFGSFLQKVMPVYALFTLLGFIPFFYFFNILLKPQFEVEPLFYLAAWLFNCIRIGFSLFGLITQLLMDPKWLSRFVLGGVVVSSLFFLLVYLIDIPLSKELFLVLTVAFPLVTMVLLVYKILSWVNRKMLLIGSLAVLALPVLFYFSGYLRNMIIPQISQKDMGILFFSIFLLGIIGYSLIVLQRKLRQIS